MDQIKVLNAGDDIPCRLWRRRTASRLGVYGTGRKLVREIYLIRGNEKLAGFGGFGQRPNPATERGIETNSVSGTGAVGGRYCRARSIPEW